MHQIILYWKVSPTTNNKENWRATIRFFILPLFTFFETRILWNPALTAGTENVSAPLKSGWRDVLNPYCWLVDLKESDDQQRVYYLHSHVMQIFPEHGFVQELVSVQFLFGLLFLPPLEHVLRFLCRKFQNLVILTYYHKSITNPGPWLAELIARKASFESQGKERREISDRRRIALYNTHASS